MLRANDFWYFLKQRIAEVREKARPVRVTVGAVANGMATVQTDTMSAPSTEYYPMVAGFAVSPGDTVMALDMNPGFLILGKLQNSGPSGLTLPAGLTIAAGGAAITGALTANSGVINGDKTTGTFRWDPTRQDTSNVASTSSTATWQTAATHTYTLPPVGTFTVWMVGFLLMTRSPAGQANLRGNINSAAGGTCIANPDISIFTLHHCWHRVDGIAGGASVPIALEFKGDSGTGVTTAAKEPLILPWWERTG